jgi:hypothetical protein
MCRRCNEDWDIKEKGKETKERRRREEARDQKAGRGGKKREVERRGREIGKM